MADGKQFVMVPLTDELVDLVGEALAHACAEHYGDLVPENFDMTLSRKLARAGLEAAITACPTPPVDWEKVGKELAERYEAARMAADSILGHVTMELGRYLYDAPSTDLVPLMAEYKVKITAKQFMDLYRATDRAIALTNPDTSNAR